MTRYTLFFLIFWCHISCQMADTTYQSYLDPIALGCELTELDSLELFSENQRTLILHPCDTVIEWEFRNHEPSPGVDSLRSWARGFHVAQGRIEPSASGGLKWVGSPRSPLLETYLQQDFVYKSWEEFTLSQWNWPDTGWQWLPPPLEPSTATSRLSAAMLQRPSWSPATLPQNFPWDSRTLDSMMAHCVAQGFCDRHTYLHHPERRLTQSFTDSLTYVYSAFRDSSWIWVNGCQQTDGFWMRQQVLKPSDCDLSTPGITHLQAQQCAEKWGGHLPSFAQWQCALYASDSLPWPLPQPLPEGKNILGIKGMLDSCHTWLKDSTGSQDRYLVIPARPSPIWYATEKPVAALGQAPLEPACIGVVLTSP